MVRGVEIFKKHFSSYKGQYAFIGGTACDIILGKLGVDFRVTKDLDMVLLIEALNEKFIEAFIGFVEEGGYQHVKKGTNENQFYRFEKPANSQFPYMIELFSRKPDFLSDFDVRLAPIHVSDDAMSLSAILLDEEYYTLLKEGVVEIDEISVLDLEYLVLFKMKAWLDLSVRKAAGEVIDSKNIKKHKNDVLRLAANIDKDVRIPITNTIKRDVKLFMKETENEPVDLKTLGIKSAAYEELARVIYMCYGIEK
ncbi:MAG: hypothetical protein ACI4D3_08565 [Lachnospiraceae bacterium]